MSENALGLPKPLVTHDPASLALHITNFVKGCQTPKAISVPFATVPTPTQHRYSEEQEKLADLLPLAWLDKVAADMRMGENIGHRVSALAPIVFENLCQGRLPDGWQICDDVKAVADEAKKAGKNGKPERILTPRYYMDRLQLSGLVLGTLFIPLKGLVDELSSKIVVALNAAKNTPFKNLHMHMCPCMEIKLDAFQVEMMGWCECYGYID